jgi:hypothetical protein
MISRKPGRPLGGKLNETDKKVSVMRAREIQRQWRIDNPDRYADSIKKYRESRKEVKEVNEIDLIKKFLKRIKCVSINGSSPEPCECVEAM